ncbi:glycolate oxidase FAD binding subunit [Loktanella ponticola]|uniref:Glycolate oxidase FAD binding subunit n=1 Tax=Yoonia ponticola TaxID=1524255 RepID=A0A7W9BLH0_9RHOB|nr:glycolate oxidase subunit GlcE [Yoonia ponticola]MBB5722615.1 glycolate oxidase FAD binding subunit [Yoonia ponticola]
MTPKNETEISEAIVSAKGPLRILGGGTRPIGKPIVGEALSTAGLSGISLYEPGALTLVAQAGTPLAEIEATLDVENQRLAFEPMDHRGLLGTTGASTIGGVVAANVSGPRRIAVGACRDFMLGVRFVDGAGQIIKNGGRVMKNVTGYDLVKLLSGSFGTLGVLTEVSLKVLPKPETTATLCIHDQSVAQAVAAMSAALGSPFEITGAAHVTDARKTLLRIEGFAKSIAYRTEQLQNLLKAFGAVDVVTEQNPWPDIANVTGFAGVTDDIWRISVRPSAAPAAVAALPATSRTMLDWGGGLIWATAPQGTDLRANLAAFKGHATLIRGTADVPTFHPEPAPLAAITAGLRAKFDPRGILNSGMMS